MHCINISHPEYKSLLETTGLHPHVLEHKISVFMNTNGTHRFPSAKEVEMIPLGKVMYNANPIYNLGRKYNANTAGFMPFNVDLAQVQRDAAKLNLTVHKAQSGSWFFKDSNRKFVNPHKFRQLETNSSKLPQKELTDKLLQWAETHGITVTTMKALIERAAETDPFGGSVAVADFLNKLIAIDPEKERLDTMAEEVAHFATLILKDDASVKKAMENIVDTAIYQEVKEAYASIYTTEEEFRKEAMDKLLAQAIVSEFQTTAETKGIMPYLKGIFNKIKRWLGKFKKTDAAEQIKKDLYPIAQSILQNEFLGNINKPNANESTVFHQRELLFTKEAEEEYLEKIDDSVEKTKAKFLIETANMLNDRLELLRKKAKNAKPLERLEKEIKDLQQQIHNKEFSAGVMGIISLAKQELASVSGLVKRHEDNNTTDGNDQDIVQKFVEMYSHLFDQFSEQMYYMNFPKEDITEISEAMQSVLKQIYEVGGRNAALVSKHAVNVLREGNTGPGGEKIDPSFDETEILNYTKEDVSAWRLGVGNYKLANSPILRTAHKLIFDAVQKVKRFALQRGDALLQAQVAMEQSGLKVEDLIEKDENGKFTQYLIREEDWAGYFKARKEMKQELARVLGFESYQDMDYNTLNAEQKSIYRTAFKKFNKENTTIVVDEKGKITGRKPKRKNPRFQEIMKNESAKAYYELLTAYKREALSKLPLQYRTESAVYMLPGIRTQFLEKMTDRNQSFLTNLKEVGKEAFFIDQDDTQFGEVSALNNRMVPIYFNQRFDNPANVSRDLTRSFTIFSEMAENFKSMGELSGNMEVILSSIRKRDYIKKGQKVPGASTNEYKALETLVEAHVYGIQKKDFSVEIGDSKLAQKLHLAGKTFSFTKLTQRLAKYISTNNLALNPFTSTAGYLKGSVDSMLEDQIGLYTTVESKNWARGEYHKNLMHVLSEVPKKKQTNKMHLLLQRSNVVELNKMLANTNKNKLLKEVTSRDMLFINYRTADYAIKGRVALSVYDNLRLVDGEFLTRKRFEDKRIAEGKSKEEWKAEWKSLRDKSLYNAYEVVNGSLQIKEEFKEYVTDAVENAATGKIQHVANTVDGTLSDTDRGALSRAVYGDFVLMHRGWFINMIDSRFRGLMPAIKGKEPSSVNMITGEDEVGIYAASYKFIKDDIIKGGNLGPWAWYGAYKGIANPAVKRGVKKTALDLMYLQIIATLAAIANVAADDDDEDNYLIQYVAYQMNRVLLEQAAGQPLMNPSEILQIIDEPVVGVRTIKDLVDISEAWNLTPYESGMYEGKTHAGKWWRKKIPGYKSIYEARFPELKNNFLKNQIISSITYDMMKEKKDGEVGGILDRLSLLFQDVEPKDEQEAVQYIDSYENDL